MDPRQQPFLMPKVDHDGLNDTGLRTKTIPASTANELLLTRRLAQIERERDNLAAELARIKLGQKALPPPPTDSIAITPDILPVLALLRTHISTLSRDNEALRYTFLGTRTASSSKVTLDPPPAVGLDLEHVVNRVKELIQENEELGVMVFEAGKESMEDYQKALKDAKAVIESLDADLEHHAMISAGLRSELDAYKAHFGSLPDQRSGTVKSSGSGRNTPSQRGRRVTKANDGDKAQMGKDVRDGSTTQRADTRHDGRGKGDGRRGRGGRGHVGATRME